uniref:Uncharacterized protein n=1 Tax=Aegilops tauschii TaxID=37682 RepID=M8B2J8_AEGTA
MARGPCLLLAPWGTLRGSPPTRTASLYIGHNRIHREEVLEMEEDIQIESADYIATTMNYHTIIISHIPPMSMKIRDKEVAPGLVKTKMGTRGGSWWFQAHLFDRRTKVACRTPIPYRCQALDQAPHGPVYPCDTAFPWWPSVPLGVSSGSERRRPQGGRWGGLWNHGSFQMRLVERKGKVPMLPCESQSQFLEDQVNCLMVTLYQYRRIKQIVKKMYLKMVPQYENPINIVFKN